MPEEEQYKEPLYDAENCPECGEDFEHMEWEEDGYFICPNCGEVQ